jgi:hypothetical protein
MTATLELVTTGGIQGDQASHVISEVVKQFPGTRFHVVQVASDSEEAQAAGVEGGVPVLLLDGFPVSRGIPTEQELQDILRQYVEEERAERQTHRSFPYSPDNREDNRVTVWARAVAQAAGTVVPAALAGMVVALDIAWPRMNRRGRRAAQRAAVAATAVGNGLLVSSIVARELEPALRGRVVQPSESRVIAPALIAVGLQVAGLAVRLSEGARRERSGLALGLSIGALAGVAATAAAIRRQDSASMREYYNQE